MQHILKLKNASIYQGESLVLSDVNFEMLQGDFVYLIGKTGTGKSSFMKTLYGDLQLTKGEGSIVNFNLHTLKSSMTGPRAGSSRSSRRNTGILRLAQPPTRHMQACTK